MTVDGRLEVTLKFSQKPEPAFTQDGRVGIESNCDGKTVRASFKTKAWKKATTLMDTYPMWVAAFANSQRKQQPTGKLFGLWVTPCSGIRAMVMGKPNEIAPYPHPLPEPPVRRL